MGTLGKVLVLVHGALGLTVLAWAVGVATNRIDWNTPPAEAGKDRGPGLYDRQKAQAAEYNVAVDRSYTRWTGNLNQVLVLEAERYPRRAYYAIHLYLIQRGKPGAEVGPRPSSSRSRTSDPCAPNGYLDVPRRPVRATWTWHGHRPEGLRGPARDRGQEPGPVRPAT